jgi:hypothetical protein
LLWETSFGELLLRGNVRGNFGRGNVVRGNVVRGNVVRGNVVRPNVGRGTLLLQFNGIII